MNGSTGTPPGGSKGVAVTNWLVSKASGFLEKKSSRRGFLIGSAMAGSAVAVAGCIPVITPGPPYTHITDCGGGLCTDGYTEFCCTINDGYNSCPPDSFWGGWWRADYSTFCNGTRYYIDCMQNCCGPRTGYQNFCAGCTECRCANGCDTRRVYCNYFRYGQCHTDIVATGPIACRVVLCVPPYSVDPACSTATLVDNATAEHTSPCITSPPFHSTAALPAAGAATVSETGSTVFLGRQSDGSVVVRERTTSWQPATTLSPTINSGLSAAAFGAALYAFGIGSDKGTWYQRRSAGSWGSWVPLQGTSYSDPVAVVHSTGLYVFVRGSDDGIWYRRTSDGVTWDAWASLGTTTQSDPAVIVNGTDLYVFMVGEDRGVWYRRLGASGPWSSWVSIHPTAASLVTAAAHASGLHVFIRGTDYGIWHQTFAGGSWSGWSSLGGVGLGDPVAVTHGTSVFVFVRQIDGSVGYRVFDGSAWGNWQALTPDTISDPTVVSDGTILSVFIEGRDANLWVQELSTSGWSGWQSLGDALAPLRGHR